MIVSITQNGKPHGSPMDDLRDCDLWWIIQEAIKQGCTVHIAPGGGEEHAENV